MTRGHWTALVALLILLMCAGSRAATPLHPELDTALDEISRLIESGKVAGARSVLGRIAGAPWRAGLSPAERAQIHIHSAQVAYHERKYDELEREANTAIALAKQQPAALDVMADALNARGLFLGEKGRTAEYVAIAAEELAIRRRLPPKEAQLWVAALNLGIGYAELGQYTLAEPPMLEALRFAERHDSRPSILATLHTNLGFLYGARKEYRSAVTMFERAVASGREITPNSMRLANRLANLGSAQHLLGRTDAARNHLREALDIQGRLAPGSLDEAQTRLLLAQLDRDAGRLEPARAGFDAAARIFRSLAGGTVHELQPRRELGETLTALGDSRGARVELEAALALAQRYVPQTGEHAAALAALGRLERIEGRPQVAERLFREALEALEIQYGLLGGSSLTRASFSTAFESLYKDLAEILIERGEFAEALRLLDRFRQQSLRERIDVLRLLEFAADAPTLAKSIGLRRKRAGELLDEIGKATAVRRSALLSELNQLRIESLEEAQAAVERNPRLGLLLQRKGASLRAPMDGQLVLYYTLGEARSHLIVIAPGQQVPTYHELPARARIESLIDRYQFLLRARADVTALNTVGAALYQAILAPAAPALGQPGTKRLLIIPDGALFALPFGALPDAEAKYLVERFVLERAPSLTALHAPGNAKKTASARYAGFAYLNRKRPNPRGSPEALETGFVQREVRDAFATIDGGKQMFLGAAATKKRVEQTADAEVLHFATHALLDPAQPLHSFIELAPESPAEDGRLEMWEIMERLRTNARLVVLSGCETAVGPVVGGEGMIGLATAFAFAGAKSIVASLWAVSDESTAAAVSQFFAARADGVDDAGALRQAQLALMNGTWDEGFGNWRRWAGLRDTRFTHPFYWAGLTFDRID